MNSPQLRAKLAQAWGKPELASTPTEFDADHIVSFKELSNNPTFRQLTAKQQMEVLHMKENLSMLASDVNRGVKGELSLDELARASGIRDPGVEKVAETARAAVTKRMETMVAKNVAERVNPTVETAKYLKQHFPRSKLAQKAFEATLGRLSAAERAKIGGWPVPKTTVRAPTRTPGVKASPGMRRLGRVGGAAGVGIGLLTIGVDLYKFFKGDYDKDDTTCDPCG